jgi:hypothetical protein
VGRVNENMIDTFKNSEYIQNVVKTFGDKKPSPSKGECTHATSNQVTEEETADRGRTS